jgi:hypothetical protein
MINALTNISKPPCIALLIAHLNTERDRVGRFVELALVILAALEAGCGHTGA